MSSYTYNYSDLYTCTSKSTYAFKNTSVYVCVCVCSCAHFRAGGMDIHKCGHASNTFAHPRNCILTRVRTCAWGHAIVSYAFIHMQIDGNMRMHVQVPDCLGLANPRRPSVFSAVCLLVLGGLVWGGGGGFGRF